MRSPFTACVVLYLPDSTTLVQPNDSPFAQSSASFVVAEYLLCGGDREVIFWRYIDRLGKRTVFEAHALPTCATSRAKAGQKRRHQASDHRVAQLASVKASRQYIHQISLWIRPGNHHVADPRVALVSSDH